MRRALLTLALSAMFALAATTAVAATHTVDQVGVTFDPDDITITVGDTVEWVWSSSSHTVTNGTGPADPNVGTLFDDPLDVGNTPFSYTFNSVGDVPYFCRPHFSLNMTGIVRVQGTTPNDEATWGAVKTLYR